MKRKKSDIQSVRIGSNWTPEEARKIRKLGGKKPATWIRERILEVIHRV